MNKKKKILIKLSEKNIRFIVIGGIALRMYNSPRVTHDIDLAIRTLDVDKVIDLMYENNYFIVKDITENNAVIGLSREDANKWIEDTKSGSMTFVSLKNAPESTNAEFNDIDLNSQVDYLFELSIPFIKMLKRAEEFVIDKFPVLLASKKDLLILKENRKNKTSSDYADIEYLKNIIKEQD